MTPDDLRKAFEAAIQDGAETPVEIARFVSLWLFPMVHIADPTRRPDGNITYEVTVVQPGGSSH